ncbi:MAG: tRNA (N6-isopentenyl adenosine(37)-C2)-methylthiotransferase MiaB [Bdellovibrionales bacterium]|nr:tRNA (N6-isopentenyl adenosine(37)-C2)-methylthiotransferase MiaB [Bdellovibrionales bacterium]
MSDPTPETTVRPQANRGRFFIKTFGCQMNVADTERMCSLLRDSGMEAAEAVEQADLILINGCSVRDKAVHKAVSTLGTYQDFVTAGRKPLLGLGGCVGQMEKGTIFRRAPYLDFVFGPDAIDQIPEIVSRVQQGERHSVYADFDRRDDYSTETRALPGQAQAFVNIMKGCDKYCTYCIVPFTRGREKSRTISEVLDDLAKLVGQGVREVTLLGQNVNSFGKGNPNKLGLEPRALVGPIGRVGPEEGEETFPMLLRAMDADPRLAELKRIRFTSSHPLDFSDQLLECYAPPSEGGVARLAPHLHLPVQSGSDRVLSKMGRKHKIESYIAQMDRLKALNPDVGLGTDLIVGFPTETEEEFEETLKLLDRVQYDTVFAFAYSPRPGTRAAKLPDDVPDEVKNRRLNQLLAHQKLISERRYAERVGRRYEVLVEGSAKNDLMLREGESRGLRVWTGRTGCNRVVNFRAGAPRSLTGRFLEVEITDSSPIALTGNLLSDVSEGSSA